MNLPQLTAEASMYKTSGIYRSSWRALSTGRVSLSQYYCDPTSVPPGSYQQSCYGCCLEIVDTGIFAYGVLHCTCPDFMGNPHSTQIISDYCSGDIANCNGQLTCGGC